MWSATDYGSFGGNTDVGGGYMASTAAGAVTKKSINQGSNVPCTCAEVMSAVQDGDKFVSPTGMEFFQVIIVGVVRSVTQSATRMEYEIDDYTGPLVPVKMFIEDQEGAPGQGQNRAFRELSYVRVIGHIRNFQGSKHVIAFRILPVDDPNEISAHILELIYARMWFTRQKLDDAGGNKPALNSTGMMNSSLSGATSQQVTNGLSVLQNQMLSIVRTFVSERGVSVSQLGEKLRGIPERQIREDLDFLSAEGHIYSTVDDDHFRSTEA